MTYSKELAIPVAPDLDKDALAVALHRKDHAPLELTPRDFDQLAIIAPELETAAREAQRQAQLAIVAQHRTKADDDAADPIKVALMSEELLLYLKKHGKQSATLKDLSLTYEMLLADWLKMNAKNIERNKRLDALERELTALKARPLLKWAGVHVERAQYAEASLVTKGGSLWVATTSTTTTPGDSTDWRLIVKKGAYEHR